MAVGRPTWFVFVCHLLWAASFDGPPWEQRALFLGAPVMPGQRGTEGRRMGHAVTVRMNADLAARCVAEATARDLSVAGWLRALAGTAVCFEQQHTRRSKPRAKVKAKPDDVVCRLVRALHQLERLSASHKRIASWEAHGSAIRSDEWESLSKLTRDVTADVVAVIQELARQ